MLLRHWYALGALATIFTLTWLFLVRRIYVSAGMSALLWGAMTLTARDLTGRLDGGGTFDASSPVLQFVALLFAVLSVLAVVTYRWGLYPPERAEQEDDVPQE